MEWLCQHFLGFVESELERHKIAIPELKEIPPAPLPKDLNELEVNGWNIRRGHDQTRLQPNGLCLFILTSIQTNLERLEDEIVKMNASMDAFRTDYTKISDIRHVMLQLQVLLQEVRVLACSMHSHPSAHQFWFSPPSLFSSPLIHSFHTVRLLQDQRTHAFQSISEVELGYGPIELHAANTGLQAAAPVLEKPRAESIMPIIPRANELKWFVVACLCL